MFFVFSALADLTTKSFSSNPPSYTHIQLWERRIWPPFLFAVLEGKCQQENSGVAQHLARI